MLGGRVNFGINVDIINRVCWILILDLGNFWRENNYRYGKIPKSKSKLS